ncbi:YceI family protein [Bdellovibrio svalbardensis]|uniref:YceI family protein n=1 Tax=Bdellovibrio svalbardensis TaxID=2972972 RepID=A0ABT6DL62_9BACT|nr:YceI family protein [Bdellovibrio svalbardensis]MDG0817616.1 YceI family protein [Bdellovibrio svalbardensis]
MIKSIFAALVLVIATTAHADTYKLDTKASSVGWKGFKKTGSSHNGAISIKDGEVQVDKKGQLTAGVFTVDMATISNEDLKDSAEYQKKLVGHLAGPDFFDVTKFPTSTFKLTSITPKSKDEVLVKGELTMIGKTNPIEFPAKVTTTKGVMTGEALVKIDRTKWGLKYGSGNFFKELAADKIISDEFELNLKLVAKK